MNRRVYAILSIVCFKRLFVASLIAELPQSKHSCGQISVKNVVDQTGKRAVKLESTATHPNVDVDIKSLHVGDSNVDGNFAKSSITASGDIQLQTDGIRMINT